MDSSDIEVIYPRDGDDPIPAFTSLQKAEIDRHIRRAAVHAAELLPLSPPIRFCVYSIEDYMRDYDAPYRIAGVAQWQHGVDIAIKRLPIRLRAVSIHRTVFHELHHIARGYVLDLRRAPLIDRVFGEGLAIAFEDLGCPAGEEFVSYDDSVWDALLRFTQEMTLREYDHTLWSIAEIYRLGKALVDRVLQAHPNTTPASLVNTESLELWRMSGRNP